jgi:lipopolysaccharide/colanic/teichoic acid biosynthesis glycosyltransferase
MSLIDVSRKSLWHTLRIQMAGVLTASFLPFLMRLMIDGNTQILANTLFGCVLAGVAGVLLFRGVGTYPGTESSAYILPSFSFSFGALLLVFVAGRFQYALSVLFGSFILSVGWLYVVYFKIQRAHDLRIGVIGEISPQILDDLRHVEWVRIASPSSSVAGLAAMAVDLRTALPDDWERRLADYALSGLPVYHIKHLYESLTGKVELEQLSESSFGSLSPLSAYMTVKHVADWVIAAVALTLLAPLLIVVALLVRLDSAGPALFRQTRIGYRGRPFTVFKFRTMRVQATSAAQDARGAAMTKTKDARITRLGAWLRKTRIDELPQLINVLRMEMSWIGPRPEAQVLSQWYENEIPFYRYRHIVRPGITGWAQVNQGHVAEIADVTSKLHYDFYYVKHFSAWIDLLIVARTIRTIVTGFGAR